MIPTNEDTSSGRRSSDGCDAGATGRDQRGKADGRRRTNWVGRYEVGMPELVRIYSASIRTISISIIVGLVIALIVFRMTPSGYRATGTILVDELPFVQMGKQGDAETERQLVQTLILSIANNEMKQALEKELGLSPGCIAFAGLDRRLSITGSTPHANVQVAAVRNSRLGSVTADSQSPEFSARVVNTILAQLNLYNQVGGSLKMIQTTAALSKSQADSTVLQLAEVSAQRIKLEQEKDQLDDYLKKGLPLENYPVFAQDATLGNLKTQLFLVESEYKALASTSTRGARLEGKASELKSLRGQLDGYARKLAESLRSEYSIRLSQEKDLQMSKQKATESLNDYSQESARLSQSFGNPEQMRIIAGSVGRKNAKEGDANMIVVVNRASPPVKPYTPLLALYLFLGAAIGGLLGFGYAFMTSLSDNALVSASQIERNLGIPCMAVFPIRPKSAAIVGGNKDAMLSVAPHLGLLLDRVLSLSAHGEFSVSGWCPVTTSHRSSVVVADLARLMAQEGRRVVVIDLHFDDPKISMALGVTVNRGLGQWLLSEESISSALNPVSFASSGKLGIIAPIQADRHLVEMIVRRKMATLVGELSKDWDHVLIDAPSLIADRSLEMVLPRYSNLILTAEYGATRMSQLTKACSAGRSREWRVKGVVITDAPRQSV